MESAQSENPTESTSSEVKIEISDVLKDVYKDVSDWLKFAEAKNAALLTFNGVMLFGVLRLLSSNNSVLLSLNKTFLFISGILILNMGIILYSFIPGLKESKKIKESLAKNPSDLNLLFYGDISLINNKAYLYAIKEKYKMEDFGENGYFKDLAIQIVTLSTIALRKNKIFKISTYITIVSLLISIGKVVFSYFL